MRTLWKLLTICMCTALSLMALTSCSFLPGGQPTSSSSPTTAVSAPGKMEGPGFGSPEDAATAFLKALQSGDLSTATSTFAIESFAEHCNYEEWLKRLSAHTSNDYLGSCPFPNSDKVGAAANIQARETFVTNSLLLMMESVVSPHLFGTGTNQYFNDPSKDIPAFQDQTQSDFHNFFFAGITDISSVPPESLAPSYTSTTVQGLISQQLPQWGISADDYQDVAMTFTTNGEQWVFCQSTARYNGKWYLLMPGGTLANVLGIPYNQAGFMQLGS